MAIYTGPFALASRPSLGVSQAGQSVTVRGWFTQTVQLAGGDTMSVVKIPANTVLTDLVLDVDRLDAGVGMVLNVGWLSAAKTALIGPVLISDSVACRAVGGGIVRITLPDAIRQQVQDSVQGAVPGPDRFLGVLVQTVAATPVAQPTAGLVNKGKWKALTAYNVGDYFQLANGTIMRCTTAGSSAATLPDWSYVHLATTADGTATWTAQGPVVGLTATYRNANYGA